MSEKQVIGFRIGQEEFGVPITKVKEIIKIINITRVPNAPSFVEGVVNLRGQVLPVIDVRRRFGLAAKEMTPETKIVIIELIDKMAGFLVDAVTEVRTIDDAMVTSAPAVIDGIDASYLSGIAKINEEKLVVLLDLDKVLTIEERQRLQEMK